MKVKLLLLMFVCSGCFASDFNQAITLVLKHEGKLSSDVTDVGGITNYGISLRYIRQLIRTRPDLMSELDVNHDKIINGYDIAHISKAEVYKIYKLQWWDPLGFAKIENQAIANKIFDMAINMGRKEAIELYQEAYNGLWGTYHLKVSGILDFETIACTNDLDAVGAREVLKAYKRHLEKHYRYLATRHPAYKKFLRGWVKRAYDS